MATSDDALVTEASDASEDEALAPDYALNPDFVSAVEKALSKEKFKKARTLVEDLHPADMADLLGLLEDEPRAALIQCLGAEMEAEVLPELDEDVRDSVVEAMQPAQLSEAIAELETDEAAFVLEDLEDEKVEEILKGVPEPDKIAVRAALDYEEDTAGRLMQRDMFSAPAYWSVGQIIDHMRGAEDLPDRFYEVFVVDPTYKPIGSVPLARVLKSTRDTLIGDVMDEARHIVPDSTDQEEVAYLFEQYNLISAPVVDSTDRLVGMITVDDVVEIIHEETHEDMLALGGVGDEEGLTDTVFTTVRRRFSWLAVNLLTAVAASVVIALFDGAIEQIVALAILMPIVASMGGNAGTQTLTVAVRSIATKDLTPSNAARIIWREVLVGGVNGVLFAVLMGGLAALWYGVLLNAPSAEAATLLGLVVGAAMIINLLAAGLAGILVPLGLQRAGADPAVASAVFVTTVTDIVGFFVFLGLAAVVLL